ncbi:MAG: type IX secretion system sortase PorU [Cytophagales bacterium]
MSDSDEELVDNFVWKDSLPLFIYEFAGGVSCSGVNISRADTIDFVSSKLLAHPNFSNKLFWEKFNFDEKNEKREGLMIFPFVRLSENKVLKVKEVVFETSTNNRVANSKLQKTEFNLPQKSIFAEGDWFRIATTREGVHRINHSQLLSLGLPLNALDPKTIQIFGSNNGMLPQANAAFRAWDPIENHIMVVGEDDGVFNESDYILIYSPGPNKWLVDSSLKRQNIEVNLYSDTVYYFITHSQNQGKRISVDQTLPNTQDPLIATSNALFHHEQELINVGKIGRRWYGEQLEGQNRTFNIPTPNLVDKSSLRISTNVVSTATGSSEYQVFLNRNLMRTTSIGGIGVSTQYIDEVGVQSSTMFSTTVDAANSLEIMIQFNKRNNQTAQAYLDFLQLEYLRNNVHFSQTGGVFYFNYALGDNNLNRFQINQTTSNTRIWDVSTYFQPIAKTLVGNEFSTDKRMRRFVAFEPENTFSFLNSGRVSNQNLKAMETPDFLIVTNPRFTSEANRLAEFRRVNDGLTVEVVELPKIYQEFSSGSQDITAIRDFARYLYLKDGNGKLKYLLLFGDCSFDYKARVSPNTNFVPVYQARNSLSRTMGFSSDDYFGFFDENEGEWAETSSNRDRLEIGIGRFPVQTLLSARQMVDKVIRYSTSPNRFGDWINEISFLSDDGDNNSHMTDADRFIANEILAKDYPNFSINKLYLNAYTQISTPVGQRSPSLMADLNRVIRNGTLVLNYTGHGSEVQLAGEALVTNQSVRDMTNADRMFLFVTATCDFGKYDDPFIVSGGEHAFLNPNGGAIACLTTTRPVYQSSNRVINQALFRCLFEKIDGKNPTLGDLLRITKNNSISGVNNRNYALLGDPSLTLHYPSQKIEITKINGADPGLASDTLKALSRIEIEGVVLDNQNFADSSFNGNMLVKIYDKQKTKFTLAHIEGGIMNPSIPFVDKGGVINQSNSTVRRGEFKFTFVVPKDISYEFGTGEIVLYAINNQRTVDALGYLNTITIGGSASEFEEDNDAPEISLFMNDTTFKNEDAVNRTSSLLAKVFDENGINLSLSGVGHEIVAVLNNNTAEPYILNDYYRSENNSFQRGVIRFPFDSLPYGRNSLSLTIWDTYNNPGTKTIFFHVLAGNPLQIQEFIVQNLLESGWLNLTFTHNRGGEDLLIELHIFDIQGNNLATLDAKVLEAPNRVDALSWNYHVKDFSLMTKGLYIYRLIVKSSKDGSTDTEIKKVVLVK